MKKEDDETEQPTLFTMETHLLSGKKTEPCSVKGMWAKGEGPALFSAEEVMAKKLERTKDILPGIVTEGVTFIGGNAKTGKSLLVLNIGCKVSNGAAFLGQKPEQGKVLALLLESDDAEVQMRLGPMLNGERIPAGLVISYEWPRLDMGGLEYIERYLKTNRGCNVVLIDMLKSVKSIAPGGGQEYMKDSLSIEPLARLSKKLKLAILVVHHLTKDRHSQDPLLDLSGSTGLVGACDNALILHRVRPSLNATLKIMGRNLPDGELEIELNPSTLTWELREPSDGYGLSPERLEILGVLKVAAGKPLGPRYATSALNKDGGNRNEHTVGNLMRAMARQGQITQLAYGKYVHNDFADRGDRSV